MSFSEKPKVDLIAILQSHKYEKLGPEELSVYGALGCFEEKTVLDLFLEDIHNLTPKRIERKKERIFKETSKRGHGAVTDQSRFTFIIEDLPRVTTLQLCLPQYLEHLQQSLRRIKVDKGFYLPEAIRNSKKLDYVVDTLNEALALYNEMQEEGIPGEDARYILPLYTKTKIMTTGNIRELMHLHYMSTLNHIPSITQETANTMLSEIDIIAPKLTKKREFNYELLNWYPSAQLFSLENKTLQQIINKNKKGSVNLVSHSEINISKDTLEKAITNREEAEIANLKHIHYTFLIKMSIACFHQAIRQRTWDHTVESIYDATERCEFITPTSIRKNKQFLPKYTIINQQMMNLYSELIKDEVPQQEAIGVIPHSLTVYDMIHVNGWNAIYSIGKRACLKAQWEIRNYTNQMIKQIRETNPVLGKYTKPQCIIFNKCPERNPCNYLEMYKKKHS